MDKENIAMHLESVSLKVSQESVRESVHRTHMTKYPHPH